MSSFPTPDRTPQGLSYEGRLLAHQHEEIVDQGLRFDLTTLVTRRGFLGVVGAGAAVLGLSACASGTTGGSSASGGSSAAAGTEIPEETAGPYPGDGSNGPDVLENSGIVRSDIRSSIDGGATATGVATTFALTLIDMANGNAPLAGAAVYAWHCDSEGRYSMYSTGLENETYLRGVQVADDKGEVAFTSIFPGCYSGRWPHIHFEVYPDVASITDSANVIATSQLAIPEEAAAAVYTGGEYSDSARNLARITLASDTVFGDDGGELQLAGVSGDIESGYRLTLPVYIDTATEAGGGGSSPPMGGAGSGPPEGGPGGGTDGMPPGE